MDVRCFSLKNAYDNSKTHLREGKINTAILELGIDENYLMVIHNNIPVITDIFLRPQEKLSLMEVVNDQIPTEVDSVIRRYSMQIKQAISDYESKYDNKINNIQVVSNLKNLNFLIPAFKKNLLTMGFIIFDPLQSIAVPSYIQDKIPLDNKSILASVLGLAYRKLDVFGYYKFVTAVKNINLLPNRDAIRQSNKLKFLSGFAAKGLRTGRRDHCLCRFRRPDCADAVGSEPRTQSDADSGPPCGRGLNGSKGPQSGSRPLWPQG